MFEYIKEFNEHKVESKTTADSDDKIKYLVGNMRDLKSKEDFFKNCLRNFYYIFEDNEYLQPTMTDILKGYCYKDSNLEEVYISGFRLTADPSWEGAVEVYILELHKTEDSIKHPHDFLPTDSQGYAMECTRCGRFISFYEAEEWNKGLKEKCAISGL